MDFFPVETNPLDVSQDVLGINFNSLRQTIDRAVKRGLAPKARPVNREALVSGQASEIEEGMDKLVRRRMYEDLGIPEIPEEYPEIQAMSADQESRSDFDSFSESPLTVPVQRRSASGEVSRLVRPRAPVTRTDGRPAPLTDLQQLVRLKVRGSLSRTTAIPEESSEFVELHPERESVSDFTVFDGTPLEGLGKAKTPKTPEQIAAAQQIAAAKLAAKVAAAQAAAQLKQAKAEAAARDKAAKAAAKAQAAEIVAQKRVASAQAKADLAAQRSASKAAQAQAKQELALAKVAAERAKYEVKVARAQTKITAAQVASQQMAPTSYPGYDYSSALSQGANPLLTQAYAPAQDYAPEYAYAPVATEQVDYTQQYQYALPAAPVEYGYDQPSPEIMSEGDADVWASTERDYFMGETMSSLGDEEVKSAEAADAIIGDSGMPRETVEVDEDRGEQLSARPIDRRFRPPMLFEETKAGLPYKTGEAMQRLRRFGKREVEIMDPSVVPLDSEDVIGRAGTDPLDFLDPGKIQGMAGLGDGLPTAKDTAVATAQTALYSLASKEQILRQYNPTAADNFLNTYAALRSAINSTFEALKAATDLDLAKSLSLTAQIGMYNSALTSAISSAKPKVVKSVTPKQQTVAMAMEMPKSLKDIILSPYGLAVLGGGAVLLGGLFFLRSRSKA